MIILIEPSNYHLHQQELEGMYRLRHQVFYEQLGWQVNSQNGLEKDEYDENHTYYLVYKDAEGKIRGCQRYVEMQHNCMFDGPFKFMLDDLQRYKKPGYWEASRLAVDSLYTESYTPSHVKKVRSSLLAASMQLGLEFLNNTLFLTLSYPSVAKLLSQHGLALKTLKQGTINGETIVVSSYPPCKESFQTLLRKAGDPQGEEPLIWYTSGVYPLFTITQNNQSASNTYLNY